MHRSASTQRERYYSGLWYTIPYDLRRDNTRNIAAVHTYVHPKKRTKRGLLYKEGQKKTEAGLKGAKEERSREEMRRKERKKKNETKIIMHALRAQAEYLGDKVAVCWCDQSCDVQLLDQQKRGTTRQDQTEDNH